MRAVNGRRPTYTTAQSTSTASVEYATETRVGRGCKLSYAATRLAISNDADLQIAWGSTVGNIFTDAVRCLAALGNAERIKHRRSELLAGTGRLRAVAYNATIQGGYFRRQNLAVSPKRLVPEAELGYVYQGSQWQFWLLSFDAGMRLLS